MSGAVISPSPWWFVTRGTGAVAMVLLTIAVALGVANVRRARPSHVPRFVVDSVHRSASLLAVAFVAAHVVTAVLDGFAPITLLDGVIPFRSAYRPVWLGLGTVACDLLLAVVVTSLLRRRFGHRAWRTTHWLAYAAWPVALVHALGTGSDARTHWMLLLSAACVAVILTAVAARVSAGWPSHLATRLSAVGAAAALPIGLAVWLPGGPLGAGWARRAGTPAALLVAAHGAPVSGARAPAAGAGAAGAPITATLSGRLRQAPLPGGLMLVDISVSTSSATVHDLHIRIRGTPDPGGGVQMTSSRASAGPQANPDQYQGRVTALQGTTLQVTLADAARTRLVAVARLTPGPDGGSLTGSMTATLSR